MLSQIKKLQRYPVIISAHGAALTLTCFLNSVVVFEIFPPICDEQNKQINIYKNMARKCGVEHYSLSETQKCSGSEMIDIREMNVELSENMVNHMLAKIVKKSGFIYSPPHALLEKDCVFKSQDKEEEFYLNHNNKKNGTVLEMGALDGSWLSNSYYLSRCLDWRAVLIEGDFKDFMSMQSSRPEAHSVNAIICEKEGEILWSIQGSRGETKTTRGIVESMATNFKNEWRRNMGDDEGTIKMRCVPISTILSSIIYPCHFDLWFLDVEGAELEVVKSFDWKSCTVDFIMYEADNHNKTKDDLVASHIIQSTGYMYELAKCAKRSRCLVSHKLNLKI
jgi:hypothetical protein